MTMTKRQKGDEQPFASAGKALLKGNGVVDLNEAILAGDRIACD
jgi:hypothetical protein